MIDTYCGRSIIDPGEVTMAEHLRARGFTTSCFGKWRRAFIIHRAHRTLALTVRLCTWQVALVTWRSPSQPRVKMVLLGPHALQREPVLTSGYCTDIFTTATMDFITEQREHRFFAYLAFNAPHTPLLVDDVWADPYRQQVSVKPMPACTAWWRTSITTSVDCVPAQRSRAWQTIR